MLRALLPIGAVAGLLAAAPPAGAATIVTGSDCYQETDSVSVAGQGFAPNAAVTVTGDGLRNTAFADGAGNVQLAVESAALPDGPAVQVMTLTASDGTNQAQTVVRITNFTFAITPEVRRPSMPVTWRVAGFPAGTRVYAHYVHRGRERERRLFGRMPAPCSILSTRLAMLPIADPAAGRWIIQLDTQRDYAPSTTPRLRLTGTIQTRRK